MLFEIFLVHIQIRRRRGIDGRRENNIAFEVKGEDLIDLPPPAVVFEDLNEERRVIAFANENLVKLEKTPLEIELDLIAVIQSLEKFAEDHFLAMNYEVLAFKCVGREYCIFRELNSKLLG